jgi:photosystem II stability/assembly factor-like uncharacterized protein
MRAPTFALFLSSLFAAVPQTPAPKTIHSGEDSSLRGLSSSRAGNQTILYATGSNGVILRSPDSGKSWTSLHILNSDTADFRGVQSFGTNIAYVFSVGNDNKSHIYKTSDAGQTWHVKYSDPRHAFFLDALACRSEKVCFAISDPIDGKFPILHTEDGEHWTEFPQESEPTALPTEGLFAASNTSLILCGPNKTDIFFATGGPAARIFHSPDNAKTWTVATTPILSGSPSAGIFSIACDAQTVVAVGGDYRNPTAAKSVAAYSTDLGAIWHLASKPPSGYRSSVVAVPSAITTVWLAAGTTGTDVSIDAGVHWSAFSHENTNAAMSIGPNQVLAVGPKGTINQMTIRPDALQ